MQASSVVADSLDEVMDIRLVVRNCVIRSHINFGLLQRVRIARARLDVVRADALRIGLFEISLAPESVERGAFGRPSKSREMTPSSRAVAERQALVALAMQRFA